MRRSRGRAVERKEETKRIDGDFEEVVENIYRHLFDSEDIPPFVKLYEWWKHCREGIANILMESVGEGGTSVYMSEFEPLMAGVISGKVDIGARGGLEGKYRNVRFIFEPLKLPPDNSLPPVANYINIPIVNGQKIDSERMGELLTEMFSDSIPPWGTIIDINSSPQDRYRNDNLYISDGESISALATDVDEYGHIPSSMVIWQEIDEEFIPPGYWHNFGPGKLEHNYIVWIDPTGWSEAEFTVENNQIVATKELDNGSYGSVVFFSAERELTEDDIDEAREKLSTEEPIMVNSVNYEGGERGYDRVYIDFDN